MTRVLVKKRVKGKEYGPYVYDVHRIGSKVVSKYLGKGRKNSPIVVQENNEDDLPLVLCRNCIHLDTSTNPAYCPVLPAFLEKPALAQPWPCSDFKKR